MQVYDEYEKRFAEARTKKELRFFTDEGVREQVIGETKMVVTVFEPCDNFEPCDDFENEINEDFLNETSKE